MTGFKSLTVAKLSASLLVVLVLTAGMLVSAAEAVPKIAITKVSPFGALNGRVWGKVSGVDPAEYRVVVYILVDDAWWVKPTLAAAATRIRTNRTWVCDITTGGSDQYATEIAAFLLPVGAAFAKCAPCAKTPTPKRAVAVAYRSRNPIQDSVRFAGYQWNVKKSESPVGPGPNVFTGAASDVWVDGSGLHLTIKEKDSRWYCTEVALSQSLGYGTYIFETWGRVDRIDPNMVLGLFTWDDGDQDPDHRELDIELARWGDVNNDTNAQFVLQPCDQCPGCGNNCSRFQVDLTDEARYLTHFLEWGPGRVTFRTYKGRYVVENPPPEALVHEWTREGSDIPEPGDEKVHLNFWLLRGNPPMDGTGSELVVSDFAFDP